MIAQIVFDLPIDGPFDYLVPESLAARVTVGQRVKVSFGPRSQIGFVIGLLEESSVSKLKSILSLPDAEPLFNDLDLSFAKGFGAYYGCSLGEALSTMARNSQDAKPSIRREHTPRLSLFQCQPDHYAAQIQKIMESYQHSAKFLILVPDTFRLAMLEPKLNKENVKFGTRSSVFESNGQYDCVVMVDDENASYKQEQTPMYETRQVLMTRARIYGFDIAFVGISPSVELMGLVREKQVQSMEVLRDLAPARLIDLSNYKFIPGLISPPVRDALEAALKAGQKGIVVLNRRGSYRLTRCVDCGDILKCNRCDSPLIYSRSEKRFLCRHCTYTAAGDTVCPKCHKPSWRSQGIGVEYVQSELKKLFPQAKVVSFERSKNDAPDDFDILIATQAVLRFQGQWQAQIAAFIDFDAELNRLDMRSAFNAFSLGLHVSSMSQKPAFIQTRNSHHYVLQSLASGNITHFYDEELKLRKEFGFSPFKHWIKLSWRGKSEKTTQQASQCVYNELSKEASSYAVTPPLADALTRKRDQFRFNVMVQANDVISVMAFIKSILAKTKRRNQVILTLNVDP